MASSFFFSHSFVIIIRLVNFGCVNIRIYILFKLLFLSIFVYLY